MVLPGWLAGLLGKATAPVLIGALGAVGIVILVAGYWMFRTLHRRSSRRGDLVHTPALGRKEAAPGIEGKALAQLQANEAERERAEEQMLASLKLPPSTKKAEVLKKQISENTKKDPAAVAQLMRTWLSEQER